MSRVKEIVQRMQSVAATQQITSAMKMVAAAKLGKLQQRTVQLQQYSEYLNTILGRVANDTTPEVVQPYFAKRPSEQLLLVVITSDRGLCGPLNTRVLKEAMGYIQTAAHGLSPERIAIMPIGGKAFDFFKKKRFKLITTHIASSQTLRFNDVVPIVATLIQGFLAHRYDQVVLAYNAFQSVATQVPVVTTLLPLTKPPKPTDSGELQYTYEASQEALWTALIPHTLQIQFYTALLTANIAEHGARMTNMGKATDNAEALLKDFRLSYNRTRQAMITQEIAEIVAGVEQLTR